MNFFMQLSPLPGDKIYTSEKGQFGLVVGLRRALVDVSVDFYKQMNKRKRNVLWL